MEQTQYSPHATLDTSSVGGKRVNFADGRQPIENIVEYIQQELYRRGVQKEHAYDTGPKGLTANILAFVLNSPKGIENVLNEPNSPKIDEDNFVKDAMKHKQKVSQILDVFKIQFSNLIKLGPDELKQSEYGLTNGKLSFITYAPLIVKNSVNRDLGEGLFTQEMKNLGYDDQQLINIYSTTNPAFKNAKFEKVAGQNFIDAIDFEDQHFNWDKLTSANDAYTLQRHSGEIEIHRGTKELWLKADDHAKQVRAEIIHELMPHIKHHFNLGNDKRSIMQIWVMMANHLAKGDFNISDPTFQKKYGLSDQVVSVFENTREHFAKAMMQRFEMGDDNRR